MPRAAASPSRPLACALILAAGQSSRMGRPKLLLPLHGKPLLQHVVDAAASSTALDEILIVVGADAHAVRDRVALPRDGRCRFVFNPDFAAGLGTSIRSGLRAVDPQAELLGILLGDQPDLTATMIDAVAVALRGADHTRISAARAVYQDSLSGGTRPGHPVFFTRAMWPELTALEGDAGARELLRLRPERVIDVRIAGQVIGDIDTPDDYRAATCKRPSNGPDR